jgi:hypothetical protein
MSSLRSTEGYLWMTHKYSPGVPDELMVKGGYPAGAAHPDTIFESATFTCADCERVVIMNPDRSRARGYCPKCNHYLCDDCETVRVKSGGECRNFKLRVDRFLQKSPVNPVIENFSSPLCTAATIIVP